MIWTLRPQLGDMVERMIRGAYQQSILPPDERELARMLGGEGVTGGVRAAAREMLDGRRTAQGAKGESNAKGESESRPFSRGREKRRGN